MIFCARATRTIRMCSSDARNRGSTRPPFEEGNEQAWKEHHTLDARSRSSISPHP
jgi:hypothetical protein